MESASPALGDGITTPPELDAAGHRLQVGWEFVHVCITTPPVWPTSRFSPTRKRLLPTARETIARFWNHENFGHVSDRPA